MNLLKFIYSFPAKNLFIIIILFINASCAENRNKDSTLINTSHLDFLYEGINVGGKNMGIIHIYSNYPGYNWIGDADEGIACVDDAARAALFYMEYYKLTGNESSFNKAENLIKFLLYMQADNGYYYNFIWPDHSINKTFKTSVAEPNWWSWRAILSLSKAYPLFKSKNENLAKEIKLSLNKAVESTMNWLGQDSVKRYNYFGGLKTPVWLPYESAADQSAILMEGLADYYLINKDPGLLKQINILGEGIIQMQKGDSLEVPYEAFLSWQNTWHAWGNNQASALLYAGMILNENHFIDNALKEIKYFYPFLIKKNYLSAFKVKAVDGKNKLIDIEKFSQIAYGIRPVVFACVRGFEITKDEKYLKTGLSAAKWFLGKNEAGVQMYDPSNGICFDGIQGSSDINKNSGAESTIEALLTLIKLEKNPVSKKMLLDYYNEHVNK